MSIQVGEAYAEIVRNARNILEMRQVFLSELSCGGRGCVRIGSFVGSLKRREGNCQRSKTHIGVAFVNAVHSMDLGDQSAEYMCIGELVQAANSPLWWE